MFNHNNKKRWHDARTTCETFGGHLAILKDESYLLDLAATPMGICHNVWLLALQLQLYLLRDI